MVYNKDNKRLFTSEVGHYEKHKKIRGNPIEYLIPNE